MSDKTEQMYFPDALWSMVKAFLFTRPICLLCETAKTRRTAMGRTAMGWMVHSEGHLLCKCVRNSNGSFTFSYVCHRHYALNSPMKLSLARKEMFYKAREIVFHHQIGTKELRTHISRHLTKQDLMRLLCSKRSNDEIGKEVLTLCKIGL